MDGPEEDNSAGSGFSRRRAALLVVFAVAGAGVFIWGAALGFEPAGSFLRGSAALVSETLGEMFFKGGAGKPAFEINLDAGSEAGSEKNYGAAEMPSADFGKPSPPAKAADENKKFPGSEGANGAAAFAAAPAGDFSSEDSSASPPIANNTSEISAPQCSFAAGGTPTHKIIFSEIAWMGSPAKSGETAAVAGNNEWLELKNNFGYDLALAGWQILSDDGKINIAFAGRGTLAAGKFYLLERSDDDSVPGIAADKIYSGVLPNNGARLRIFDEDCALADEINASGSWPGGDNSTKQTLERNILTLGWQTSVSPGGTPKAENSSGAIAPPVGDSVADAGGRVGSAATAGPDATAPSSTASAPQTQPAAAKVLLSEILYDAPGSDAGREFVELYNAGTGDVNLAGWTVKKEGGSLATIGSKPEDRTTVKAGGFFLVGLNGYNESPPADAVRSASLPNVSSTIYLYDAAGNLIESVSYNDPEGTFSGQSYERVSWSGSQFAYEPNPNPRNSAQ